MAIFSLFFWTFEIKQVASPLRLLRPCKQSLSFKRLCICITT